MLKTIGLSFLVICVVYLLFYPALKKLAGGRSLFKWFIIFYLIAVVVSSITTYIL